jgi:5-(carboxyamino)imidazole ribonucleotide synthase
MVNLIGEEPSLEPILAIPGAHLHRYGKQPRPGRKLGHVTFTAEDERLMRERVANIPGISLD